MGLDIMAVSHIEKVLEHQEVGDDDPIHIPEGTWSRGIAPGVYRHTTMSKEFYFNAGSYGTYNRWRNKLSVSALGVPAVEVWGNFEAFEGKPFAELIHFSDCEGQLGPEVCFKLANDFRRTPDLWLSVWDRMQNPYDDRMWFGRVAEDFFLACKIAASGGVLIFC